MKPLFAARVEEQINQTRGVDPGLLEQTGADEYRLRFFPVPAAGEQIATVVLAVEAVKADGAFELRVPLDLRTNFGRRANRTRDLVRVSVCSGAALAKVESPSHDLRATLHPGSREYKAGDQKIRTIESNAALGVRFTFVRHAAGCASAEPNPDALKEIAAKKE